MGTFLHLQEVATQDVPNSTSGEKYSKSTHSEKIYQDYLESIKVGTQDTQNFIHMYQAQKVT